MVTVFKVKFPDPDEQVSVTSVTSPSEGAVHVLPLTDPEVGVHLVIWLSNVSELSVYPAGAMNFNSMPLYILISLLLI